VKLRRVSWRSPEARPYRADRLWNNPALQRMVREVGGCRGRWDAPCILRTNALLHPLLPRYALDSNIFPEAGGGAVSCVTRVQPLVMSGVVWCAGCLRCRRVGRRRRRRSPRPRSRRCPHPRRQAQEWLSFLTTSYAPKSA
jgi:hypothetical protein